MYTVAIMQKNELEKFSVEKKEGSQVVITGELPFEIVVAHRAAALADITKDIEIDGFRKGHVPEAMVVRKVGQMAILTEMAERALEKVYPEIIQHHSLDVIGYPKIGITKIAEGNPLGFTITVAVVPEVVLPEYFKIAKDINTQKESKEVTEDEVTKQINDILRQKVAYERLQNKAQKNTEPHEHGPDCDHEHEHTDMVSEEEKAIEEVKDIPLPELTDAYVKSLGKEGQFENVEDFRNKIKEHLTIEKSREVDSTHRAKITDALIEKSVFDLPQVLLDAELRQMFAQMEDDLKRAQLTIEDYLAHIKKTKEELIAEWSPQAEKRARLQLVLNAIAQKESITPDPSMVDHEVSHLIETYKDADEKRVRVYVESVLTNEEVLKKLEVA